MLVGVPNGAAGRPLLGKLRLDRNGRGGANAGRRMGMAEASGATAPPGPNDRVQGRKGGRSDETPDQNWQPDRDAERRVVALRQVVVLPEVSGSSDLDRMVEVSELRVQVAAEDLRDQSAPVV